MAGLSLDIGSNTRAAQRNVRDLGEALDEVADALDDVARDGAKSGDKLEGTFRDMVRDSDDAGRKIKKNISGGLKEAGSEAGSSGREAAASFSGEFEDVSDFLQETMANAFSGFGPLGAAAGVAAAIGLGAVTAELTKQQEGAQRLKEYFADAYQTAAEEGRNYLDTATILKQAQDLLFNPDRAGEYNRALEVSKQIGVDINTIALARAGDQEALNVVIRAAGDAYDEVKAKSEEQGSTAIRLSMEERKELERVKREYEGIGALVDENAERASNAQSIRDDIAAREAKNVDKVRGAVDALMGKRSTFDGLGPVRVPVDYSQVTAAERALSALQRRALSGVSVAVNMSGRQLLQ